MNIKDGYISGKVTFDTQYGLEEKIDKLTSMMSKLTAQDDNPIKPFKPKIYQQRGQTKKYMIDMIYGQRDYQNIDKIVEIEEFHLVVEYSTDKIAEIDQDMIRTIEMTLEQKIVEGIQEQIRIIEDRITGVDTKEIVETIMKDAEVGLGIDNFLTTSEEMIEVIVGIGQV